MSRKLSLASAVMTAIAALMAVLLLSVTPALAVGPEGDGQGQEKQEAKAAEETSEPAPESQGNGQAKQEEKATSSESDKGAENTPGNDRKEGYEDNSTTPQETNHGKGADNDGDADSDPNTATEDDHTTADEGDNAHPSGKDRSVENGGSGNQGKSESNPDDSRGPMRYEGGQGDDKPNGPGGTDRDDQDGNNGCGNDDDFDDDNNGWCGKPKRTTPVKPTDTNTPTCPNGSTMPANGKCETPKTCPNGSAMPANGKCDEVLGEVITKTCPNGSAMPTDGKCGDVITKTCPNGSAMPTDGNCGVGLEVRPSTPADEVLGEIIENPTTPDGVLGVRLSQAPAKPEAPVVLGVRLSPALAQPVAVAGAVLPFTGGDLLVFLVAAFGLMIAGAVSLRVRRNNA